jgi:hypothetical protein
MSTFRGNQALFEGRNCRSIARWRRRRPLIDRLKTKALDPALAKPQKTKTSQLFPSLTATFARTNINKEKEQNSRPMADDDDACWICLAGAEAEDHHHHHHEEGEDEGEDEAGAATKPTSRPARASLGPLLQVCACPRKVHASCSARWQLHSAGKRCVLCVVVILTPRLRKKRVFSFSRLSLFLGFSLTPQGTRALAIKRGRARPREGGGGGRGGGEGGGGERPSVSPLKVDGRRGRGGGR